MKLKKVSLFLLLSFSMVVTMFFGVVSVNAIDYEKEESKWKNICLNPKTSVNNKNECRGYTEYLDKKVSQAESDVSEYKGKISEYENDLAKQVELAQSYEVEMKEIEEEIKVIEANIIALEASIRKIEIQIIEREEEIAEKDRIIVDRMQKTQSDIRFGYEIDFLVKAKDFATLIASASAVTDIMEFEKIKIEEINQLINQQEQDKAAILLQQETLELSVIDAENKKAEVVILKAEVDVAIDNYQRKMAEITALQNQATANASAIKGQMQKIEEAIATVSTSTGFVRPIAGGYISARVWAYPAPWSAMHIGYDYAAPVGTPIRAAANGVVLASYDGCPTIGYLGNSCGNGMRYAGNQIYTLVTVNNSLYGIKYFHLEAGSPISGGQTITAGQTIGRVGSSGNSTGPHAHVEVIYLGERSINDYISTWNGSLHHNIGMNMSNRCIDKGNNAPCRMDPGQVFGSN